MPTCLHPSTRILTTRPFTGPVARGADENRAAHGNVDHLVECSDCGAQRSELVNRHHEEIGDWGPTRAQREAADRREAQARQDARDAARDDLGWLYVLVSTGHTYPSTDRHGHRTQASDDRVRYRICVARDGGYYGEPVDSDPGDAARIVLPQGSDPARLTAEEIAALWPASVVVQRALAD